MSLVTLFEFTNVCECENEDGSPFDCGGECYGLSLDNLLFEIVNPWLARNDLDYNSTISIIGMRMGWQQADGVATTRASASGLVDALSVRSEFRLVFRLDGKDLTANRYSHDEPMGAPTFIFVPEVTEGE